jgi:hypothetical protein
MEGHKTTEPFNLPPKVLELWNVKKLRLKSLPGHYKRILNRPTTQAYLRSKFSSSQSSTFADKCHSNEIVTLYKIKLLSDFKRLELRDQKLRIYELIRAKNAIVRRIVRKEHRGMNRGIPMLDLPCLPRWEERPMPMWIQKRVEKRRRSRARRASRKYADDADDVVLASDKDDMVDVRPPRVRWMQARNVRQGEEIEEAELKCGWRMRRLQCLEGRLWKRS